MGTASRCSVEWFTRLKTYLLFADVLLDPIDQEYPDCLDRVPTVPQLALEVIQHQQLDTHQPYLPPPQGILPPSAQPTTDLTCLVYRQIQVFGLHLLVVPVVGEGGSIYKKRFF